VVVRKRHFYERSVFISTSTFSDFGLSPNLLRGVRELGFETPTPVQRMAIPPCLAGSDVLASAQTGSGKSAAFGLPILEAVLKAPASGTQALILVPTRELAQQITDHLRALAKHTNVRIAAVYGGVRMASQIQAFRRNHEIIVATPGRLIDLISQGEARLNNISTLVLDEADRMLDMGFLPAVRRIVAKLPNRKQTLFFSATLAGTAGALANELLSHPVRINLAPTTTPVESVTQTVYAVDQHKKTDLLVDLLADNSIYSALVFTRTKHRAERLAGVLSRHNVGAERIHGDRSQAQRARALEAFKKGRYRVLVATDVAARGIDIADLGHVINYDVPNEAADYVHRIGRTGRAQKVGDAITFVSQDEVDLFAAIERSIGKRVNRGEHRLSDASVGKTLETPPPARRRTFQRRRRR